MGQCLPYFWLADGKRCLSLHLLCRLAEAWSQHQALAAPCVSSSHILTVTCFSVRPSEPSASASSKSAGVRSTSPDSNEDRPSCAAMMPLQVQLAQSSGCRIRSLAARRHVLQPLRL